MSTRIIPAPGDARRREGDAVIIGYRTPAGEAPRPMPDQPTIYFASRGKVLALGALLIALGGACASPSWGEVQALLDGKAIADLRAILILPGALFVVGVGLL
jgi:hypothetical protein